MAIIFEIITALFPFSSPQLLLCPPPFALMQIHGLGMAVRLQTLKDATTLENQRWQPWIYQAITLQLEPQATPATDWQPSLLQLEASPCPGSGMTLCSYLTLSGLTAPSPLAGSCGMEPSTLPAHPQKPIRTGNPFMPYIKDSPTLGPLDNALLKANSSHIFPIKPRTTPLSSTTMAESLPVPT